MLCCWYTSTTTLTSYYYKLATPSLNCVLQTFFKLTFFRPGGKLKPGESDIEGLKRKLDNKLAPVDGFAEKPKWEISDLLATWWRPNFETLMVGPLCMWNLPLVPLPSATHHQTQGMQKNLFGATSLTMCVFIHLTTKSCRGSVCHQQHPEAIFA